VVYDGAQNPRLREETALTDAQGDLSSIVRRARHGDEGAFAELVRRFHRHAFQTAWGVLRSREDAEEVVQDAFVRALTRLPDLRDDGAFPGWLTTLVTRLAIDRARAERRRPQLARHDPPEPWHQPNPLSALMIDEALGELSPEHRAVVLLRERDGYEYEEIAQIVGIPVGTVKSRLSYARQALRKTALAAKPPPATTRSNQQSSDKGD
jgi:RNA polymerase sigma-70 factor (ECF subfamily)